MDPSRGEVKNPVRRSFNCPNKRWPCLRPESGSRRQVNGDVGHCDGETGGGGLRGKTTRSVIDTRFEIPMKPSSEDIR